MVASKASHAKKKKKAATRSARRPPRATNPVATTTVAAAAVDATAERPATRSGATARSGDHGEATAKKIKYNDEPSTDGTVSSLEDSVASDAESDFEQPRKGKKKAIIVNNENDPKSKQEASKKKAKPAGAKSNRQGKGDRTKVLTGPSPVKTTDDVPFYEDEDRNGSMQVHEATVNPKTDDWRVWAVLDY